MDLHLNGKKALVTGASQGIGEAIAKILAVEGARVALAARRREKLSAVLASLGGRSQGHVAVAVDLAKDDGPRTLCSKLKDFGSPDIVIHNLGGSLGVQDPLCDLTHWRKVFRINCEIAVELNNWFIPEMKRNHWGRIIHISSVSGAEDLGTVTYCSAKAALNAYTRSLGRALAPEGIIVCAVMPGMVLAPGGHWDKASTVRVRKALNEQLPMKRFARPDEIASIVAFLSSEHASQCAGSVIPADGGYARAFSP
jgi:3-oxoacyl-[acyl-carrier protein] reductase